MRERMREVRANASAQLGVSAEHCGAQADARRVMQERHALQGPSVGLLPNSHREVDAVGDVGRQHAVGLIVDQ
eukprot:5179686-Lingulodinium_polyedra.AAC.1